MDLETRFRGSQDNIKPIRYSEKTVMDKDHSKLNIDKAPKKYTGGVLGDGKDRSLLNIDKTPAKYHP